MEYRLSFSVNSYNECGEMYEKNIQLHLNNGTIISFKSMKEYESFIEQMKDLRNEIEEDITRLNEE